MVTRSTVVTAALAAAAALAATGITYASAASSEPAQAAPVVQQASAPMSALNGGDAGNGNSGKGNEGKGNEGKGGGYENKGGGNENRGHREHFRGRIQINERTYSAEGGGCVTVVSGLGSKTLNIRNESRRTVEVFRGATCDNGAPLATVGPWSSSDGVHPGRVKGGVKVRNGVVGSFRVIERHHDGGGYGGDDRGGDFGGDYGDDY
ncbi:hypothetical protein P6B95_05395 [Streptomyces atratus]|uniref:hypothetical protein n=2 Tax=Streptomyces atratus TaxID=1893 RepID=UPI0019A2B44D|nr:hypothetical protein [Streptomyces atratus]WPW26889.1 hypothetical protein P6B95_05395 [Streptomyces atratus]GGT55256.1 hypothetical protein GCM10010207_63940 [Streptomyces atratus]